MDMRASSSACSLCAVRLSARAPRSLTSEELSAIWEFGGKIVEEIDGEPVITAVMIRRRQWIRLPKVRQAVWAAFDRPRFPCPYSSRITRHRPIVGHGGSWTASTGESCRWPIDAASEYEPTHRVIGAHCLGAPVGGCGWWIKPLLVPRLPRRLVELSGELGRVIEQDFAPSIPRAAGQ